MRPLVIQVENSQTHKKRLYAFTSSPVSIGRNELNHLPLRDEFVSLWHSVVRFDDESIKYVDLGSTNGTRVNGAKIEANKPLPVTDGMALEIGHLRLEFSRDPALAEQAEVEHTSQFRESSGEGGEEPPAPVPDTATRIMSVPTKALEEHRKALEETKKEKDVSARRPSGERSIPVSLFPKQGAKGAKERPPRDPQEHPTLEGQESIKLPEDSTIVTFSPWASKAQAPVQVDEAPPRPALRPSQPEEREPPADTSHERHGGAPGSPQALLEELRPLYARFRESWKALRVELSKGLSGLPRAERPKMIELIRTQMPEVLKEEQFEQMLSFLGLLKALKPKESASESKPPAATPAAEGAAMKLLSRFARSYVPDVQSLASATESERLLERVADVLETCAKAFVELRKGHGQFADQMAVRTSQQETPLHRAKDGREVLRYVLDWRAQGRARVDELMGGFTEVMVHEIALLNGLREGVRGLLGKLSPEDIEEEAGGFGPLALPSRWRLYIQRYHDLVDEEQATTAALFGPEFARAYSAIVGEGGEGDEESEEDEGGDEDEGEESEDA